MTYSTIPIRVPTEMAPYLQPRAPRGGAHPQCPAPLPRCPGKTISHGRAAEILGITNWELLELYNSFGLAYLDMDISEVEADLANWERLKAETCLDPLHN